SNNRQALAKNVFIVVIIAHHYGASYSIIASRRVVS
ncbi:MAG: hypothetical protein ACI9BC_002554, partial [Crocinitomicaceae bacterium]